MGAEGLLERSLFCPSTLPEKFFRLWEKRNNTEEKKTLQKLKGFLVFRELINFRTWSCQKNDPKFILEERLKVSKNPKMDSFSVCLWL